jgi:PAS domain S-box-containing protein
MERLRAAFDDSFVAQLIVTPDGKIQDANRQACRVLEHSREEIVTLQHADLTDDEGVDMFEGLVEHFENNNIQNWQTELRYKSGMWATVNVSAVRRDKKVTALLLQLQDITTQKKVEENLQRNNEDLEQFVHIATHDLREPLVAVAGFADLVRKRYGAVLGEEGLGFINQVIESAQVMEKKIDDLLAFSKAGRMTTTGTFPLGAAIEEARRSLVRRIEEGSATFSIPNDLPVVQGDRSMIAQVFQNLFSNSIKYRGEQPPRISVEAEHQGDFWLIKVRDNGIGFNMEHKDRIFGVFQRLYTIEQYPGTGIGLAIAKKIVDRHGGRIWTASEPNKGSTFFFTLPAVTTP